MTGLTEVTWSKSQTLRRILRSCGLDLYNLSLHQLQVHDRMTEEVYKTPLKTFHAEVTPAPVYTVPLLEKGRSALEEINEELGLGFDEWDKDYYWHMFTQDLKRDPTSVELFDMAQSNSEHRCEIAMSNMYSKNSVSGDGFWILVPAALSRRQPLKVPRVHVFAKWQNNDRQKLPSTGWHADGDGLCLSAVCILEVFSITDS